KPTDLDRVTNRYLHERQSAVDKVLDRQVIPAGGTDGQVLTKASDNDYDVDWETPSAGGSSPLTTKGDIFGYSTTNARIPVGTDGQILTANSAQALGVEWADAGSSPGVQTQLFTSSGSFVVPLGITEVLITAVAPGGSGSGIASTSGSGGGGSGEYCIQWPLQVTSLATYTVTIGAAGAAIASGSASAGNDGGNVSFGSLLTLLGGKGGGLLQAAGAGGGVKGAAAIAGAGSIGSSESPLHFGGSSGGAGFNGTSAGFAGGGSAGYSTGGAGGAGVGSNGGGGGGGASPWGAGGAGGSNGAGGNAVGYGDGGGGASGKSSGNNASGAGGPGFLLVSWEVTGGSTGATGAGVPTGGTAGQVLSKIDSTDYNTQWTNPSGACVKIAKVVTSGSASTITFSSIPATYTDLKIVFSGRDTATGTGDSSISIQLNGDTTTANYQAPVVGRADGTTASSVTAGTSSAGAKILWCPGSSGNANAVGGGEILIPNYAGTTFYKILHSVGFTFYGSTPTLNVGPRGGVWKSTSAISSIVLTAGTTAFVNGTTA